MQVDQDMELRKGVFAFWWWKVLAISSHGDYFLLMIGTGLVPTGSGNQGPLRVFGSNDFLVQFC